MEMRNKVLKTIAALNKFCLDKYFYLNYMTEADVLESILSIILEIWNEDETTDN